MDETTHKENLSSKKMIKICFLITFLAFAVAQYLKTQYDDHTIFLYLFVQYDYWALWLLLLIFAISHIMDLKSVYKITALFKHTWAVALVMATALSWLHFAAYKAHPLSVDEYCLLFQAKVFGSGQTMGQWPTPFFDQLIVPKFVPHFFASLGEGNLFCRYWPGHSLLLSPFAAMGVPWLYNILIAVACLYVVKYQCRFLFPKNPHAHVWGTMFLIASPNFLVNAVSFYPNTFYVFSTLTFSALLLKPTGPRLLCAGFLGSIAVVQHQPVPHIFFVMPWFLWLLRQEKGFRKVLILGSAYLPIGIGLGLGWLFWQLHHELPNIRGETVSSIFGYLTSTPDTDSRIYLFFSRFVGLFKIWAWAAPGLVVFAVWGFVRNRKSDTVLPIFGYSALTVFIGYFFTPYDSGHGWGFRYFEGAWGTLIILGVAGVLELQNQAREQNVFKKGGLWANKVMTLILAGLMFVVPLRFWHVNQHMTRQLQPMPHFSNDDSIEIGFVYRETLVQNDPFLKNSKVLLWSQGPEKDQALMKQFFPNFVKVGSTGRHFRLPPYLYKAPSSLSSFELWLLDTN